jgi:hypothetical protein
MHHDRRLNLQLSAGHPRLQPGEKVAVVDAGLGDGWEKLARVSVVAEIADGEEKKFWAADLAKRTQIYQLLAKTGAYLLIAPEIPDWASTNGWERVGDTSVHLLHLSQ